MFTAEVLTSQWLIHGCISGNNYSELWASPEKTSAEN